MDVTSNTKVAFIGGGNMASAMIQGLLSGGFKSENIWAFAPSLRTRNRLIGRYQVQVEHDNANALRVADIIIIAVKPQQMQFVCEQLNKEVQANGSSIRAKLILSAAAGVAFSSLKEMLHKRLSPVAIMPNLPCAFNQGVIGVYSDLVTNSLEYKVVEDVLSTLGQVIWLSDESQLPVVVAASGSAPAYFLLMLEHMENTALNMGLTQAQARQCVLQSAQGAAALAEKTSETFTALRKQVTSPNGTTQQALNVFNTGGFQHLVFAAMQAAKEKASPSKQKNGLL